MGAVVAHQSEACSGLSRQMGAVIMPAHNLDVVVLALPVFVGIFDRRSGNGSLPSTISRSSSFASFALRLSLASPETEPPRFISELITDFNS
jgi:hypothetical protein